MNGLVIRSGGACGSSGRKPFGRYRRHGQSSHSPHALRRQQCMTALCLHCEQLGIPNAFDQRIDKEDVRSPQSACADHDAFPITRRPCCATFAFRHGDIATLVMPAEPRVVLDRGRRLSERSSPSLSSGLTASCACHHGESGAAERTRWRDAAEISNVREMPSGAPHGRCCYSGGAAREKAAADARRPSRDVNDEDQLAAAGGQRDAGRQKTTANRN